MHTILHSKTRKIFFGLLLLGFFVFLVCAANLSGAHAQEAVATPTPLFIRQGVSPKAIPPDFSKIKPADGATGQGTDVTLTWETDGSNLVGYYHCADKTNNGICDSNIWIWNNDTNRTLHSLDPGSTYYWQVMACSSTDPGGCRVANYGEWWSFTVAPVVFNSVGAKDGWILESHKGSGVGGSMNSTAATFQLGDDASNRQYRAILSFDTSSLPDTAVITSAVLKIAYSGSPVGSNPFNLLGTLYADIKKGWFGGSSNLEFADFNASASAGKVAAFGKTPVSGWYSATLNSTGRSNINRTGLTQFRLFFNTATNNNNAANYMKFVSGDGSSKPQLIIKYKMP